VRLNDSFNLLHALTPLVLVVCPDHFKTGSGMPVPYKHPISYRGKACLAFPSMNR